MTTFAPAPPDLNTLAMHPAFDVIVVGAGVMGSACAYRLARAGHRVLLLEQFDFLHRRGSSHGESRIIRRTYVDDRYTRMMPEAYALWTELEQETGTPLYTRTGGIDFGPADSDVLRQLVEGCDKHSVPIERLTGVQARERWPFHIPDDYTVVYQRDTGVLNATKAVHALQVAARLKGAVLRDRARVVRIFMARDIVSVDIHTGERYNAKHLVICPGPWANPLLEKIGLHLETKVQQVTLGYFRTHRPSHTGTEPLPADRALSTLPGHTGAYHAQHSPVFIMYDKDLFAYGLPGLEFPDMVKIGMHFGDVTSADDRDFEPSKRNLDLMRERVIDPFMPHVNRVESTAETCLYTMTPNENFIIDHHPHFRNVIVAAGFSGHGFKFGVLIGELVSKMVDGKDIEYDMSMFSFANCAAMKHL